MNKKKKISVPPSAYQKTRKYKIPEKYIVKYRECCPHFGFRYCIDKPKNNTFSCIQKNSEFYLIFKNFKRMSSMTWGEIEQAHDFHAHPAENFNKFPKKVRDAFEKLDNPSPYRFKIFKEARIYGFFNSSNIFEIIFFDRSHEY